MTVLRGLTVLLTCQMAGELISRALETAVPGPVIGLVILFASLCVAGRRPAELDRVADGLLGNLALLFVPAGVGVIRYGSLIAQQWLPICVALFGSTVITLAVTATATRIALSRQPAPPE
jgi:holin-like protein